MPSEFYEYCYGSISTTDNQLTVNNDTHPTAESAEIWGNESTRQQGAVLDSHDILLRDIKYFVVLFAIPIFCVLGVIGNIVNILVLTRRRMKATMDCRMERAAYIGLIALAVSDSLFCLSTFPNAFLGTRQTFFYSKGFRYFIKRYGPYFQNSFSHISTWLTVVMAFGRYAAICYPLHARQFVHAKGTKIGIAISIIVWFILDVPRLWEYEIAKLHCAATQNDERYMYVLDRGYFSRHRTFRITMMYIWFVLGFFIPVSTLAFCNIKLIQTLRQSWRMRREFSTNTVTSQAGKRITPTLVAIVVMFIILVSPSEVANFMYYIIGTAQVEGFRLAIVITNMLHTLNFAINFILYCVVNVHFRETMMELCCLVQGKAPHQTTRRIYTASYSNVGNSKVVISPTQTETINI